MNEFDQMFAQLNQMFQAAAGQMTPQQKSEFMQKLMQANMQMGQLDDLARQRYDNRMSDLMGMAGSAGIDWTPPTAPNLVKPLFPKRRSASDWFGAVVCTLLSPGEIEHKGLWWGRPHPEKFPIVTCAMILKVR
jgi:hypothetical protein